VNLLFKAKLIHHLLGQGVCKAEVLSEGVCNCREGLLQFALLISEEPCRKRCYLEWFVDTLDVQVELSLVYSNPSDGA